MDNHNFAASLCALLDNFSQLQNDALIVAFSDSEAESYYKLAKLYAPQVPCWFLPSWDCLPYDRISPSKRVMAVRAQVLSQLAAKNGKVVLFTAAANLLQKLPHPANFQDTILTLKAQQSYSRENIASFLVKNGFNRTTTALEVGEFAVRGEIMDIVIADNEAYRLNWHWQNLETIKKLDPLSQVSATKVSEFTIYSSSEMLLHSETINNFKANFLKVFSLNHNSHPIYLAVSEGYLTAAAEHLLPLCYNEPLVTILAYLFHSTLLCGPLVSQALSASSEEIADNYQRRFTANRTNPREFYPALPQEALYLPLNEAEMLLKGQYPMVDSLLTQNDLNLFSLSRSNNVPIGDLLQQLYTKHKNQKIIICCPHQSIIERIKSLAITSNLNYEIITSLNTAATIKINIVNLTLSQSFAFKDLIMLRSQDIIGDKYSSTNTPNSKKIKNILLELETLSEGELVIHEEHGIGRFCGVETLEVSGLRHDCVKIIYAEEAILYVPVENLNLIKKYGNEEAQLDKLGGVSWQRRKSRLKERIGELAHKLLATAAARKMFDAEAITPNDIYRQFAERFPYPETDDQLAAIADIESDFASGKIMDRLICGDVGFGKTEVAMRAACLTAAHGKQVAIAVPTTILARQHFNSFIERFQHTGLKIAQLSRLVTPAQATTIKHNLREGKIDIVIGTHALLAPSINFQDLGLIIVDEEQHFGVAQKERLKELKTNTNMLALSATPIPRTLQMSLLGIRDLSLITTPPIDRLAVKATIINNDSIIIREALLREKMRGGRSFYVCPRIKDIPDVEKMLESMVPELKYIIAHGQMPASTIDQIMGDFYDGKYDILLCTTIIESGIDVPVANTMIIYKAEILGLSQLYQLRGRVGRSKARGFVYLVLSNSKTATKNAYKRLEIVQNIDSLGAGFMIASHDMDIRGFGNLVGDEQSGHIREVGAELYQEMLEEAIQAITHKGPEKTKTTDINIGIPVFLPEDYVNDPHQRMALYRRISILASEDEIESLRDELVDRFGTIPDSVSNLLLLLKIKLLCQKIFITKLDIGPNGTVLTFAENPLVGPMALSYVQKYPRHTKLRPENKLVITQNLTKTEDLPKIIGILEELHKVSFLHPAA